MIPPHSCAVPGRKPGHVDEGDERDVERVAGADEPRRLRRSVDVEHAGERVRLVADDADAEAAEPREAADDVLGEARLELEEVAVVDDERRSRASCRTASSPRRERACRARAPRGRPGRPARRTAPPAGSTAAGSSADSAHPRAAVSSSAAVRCATPDLAACASAPPSSSSVTSSPVTVSHDVGAGDEHVRRALDHQHEVGHRGRVDGAARARPHHERELRHDARELHVPPEDLRVARERDDAFLDPRAAGVVDPDHRAAVLPGQVEHLADLLGDGLRERAAEDGRSPG